MNLQKTQPIKQKAMLLGKKLDPQNKLAIDYNDCVTKYLNDICKPVFDNFGCTLFEYIRLFFDNTCINISTNQKWLIHNYTQCPMGTVLEKHLKLIPIGSTRYILNGFTEKELQNPMLAQAYSFDIWNGLCVYKRYQNECECFLFATTRNNASIVDFYMNERTLIEKFIYFFKEKAAPFIDDSDLRRRTVLMPERELLAQAIVPTVDNRKNFINQVETHKFSFCIGNEKFQFSKKETQCLCLSAYGNSAKQIARVLGISPRTVEDYLSNIKRKTNINDRAVLINSFHENIGTQEYMKIFI